MKGSKAQVKNKDKDKSKAPKDDKKKKQQPVPELPEKKNKQKIDELKVPRGASKEVPNARCALGHLSQGCLLGQGFPASLHSWKESEVTRTGVVLG